MRSAPRFLLIPSLALLGALVATVVPATPAAAAPVTTGHSADNRGGLRVTVTPLGDSYRR